VNQQVLRLVLIACLVPIGFSSLTIAAEPVWVKKASLLTPRYELGLVNCGDAIYAIGGMDSEVCLNVNEQYDDKYDSWTTRAPMPTARASFAIAVCRDKIFVIGGIVGTVSQTRDEPSSLRSTDVNEAYDPETDTWETRKPFPESIAEITASAVNDTIYVLTESQTWAYQPKNDTWTRKATHAYLGGLTSVAYDTYVVLFGAIIVTDGHTVPVYKTVSLVYNVVDDSWSSGTTSPTYLSNPASCIITDPTSIERIYVAGYPNNTMQYTPTTSAWETAPQFPGRRIEFRMTAVNNKVYIMGGAGAQPFEYAVYGDNEQYTPFPEPTPTPPISSTAYPTSASTPLDISSPTPQAIQHPGEQPTFSQSPSPSQQQPMEIPEYNFITLGVVVALIFVLVLAVFLRHRLRR
jgi:N-acetylneuraminic acid mutarotase